MWVYCVVFCFSESIYLLMFFTKFRRTFGEDSSNRKLLFVGFGSFNLHGEKEKHSGYFLKKKTSMKMKCGAFGWPL